MVPGACRTLRAHKNILFQDQKRRGAWVAQSVKHLTSVQVMISRFMGSSRALGSVLTAQSLEPVSDSVIKQLKKKECGFASFCFFKCLFIYLGGGGAERGERIPRRLRAASAEPNSVFDLMNCDLMT